MDELEQLRMRLQARTAACWDRFDDAVTELIALHEVSEDEIALRVAEALRRNARPSALEDRQVGT